MEDLHMAKVDYEEARKTADLMSYFQDLPFTVEALDRLKQMLDNKLKDQIIATSLWTAALVSYARAFSTGKRFGLSEKLFEHIKDGLEGHQLFIEMRNKHIAHSVNPFGQVIVGLVLSPPTSSTARLKVYPS